MWTAPKLGVVLIYACCLHTVFGASISENDDKWAKHHNYEEMLGVLKEVHEMCPSISYLYNLTGHPDQTTQARKLAVLVLSDKPESHEIGMINSCCILCKSIQNFLQQYICIVHALHTNFQLSSVFHVVCKATFIVHYNSGSSKNGTFVKWLKFMVLAGNRNIRSQELLLSGAVPFAPGGENVLEVGTFVPGNENDEHSLAIRNMSNETQAEIISDNKR